MIDSEKIIGGVIDPKETVPPLPQQRVTSKGHRGSQRGQLTLNQHCIFVLSISSFIVLLYFCICIFALLYFCIFIFFCIFVFVTSEGHSGANSTNIEPRLQRGTVVKTNIGMKAVQWRDCRFGLGVDPQMSLVSCAGNLLFNNLSLNFLYTPGGQREANIV